MKTRAKVVGKLWEIKVMTLYPVCHRAGESLSELPVIHLL